MIPRLHFSDIALARRRAEYQKKVVLATSPSSHHVECPGAHPEPDPPDAKLLAVAGLAVDLSVGGVVDGEGVEVAAAGSAREAALVPRLQS